jgi:hypothetical protein
VGLDASGGEVLVTGCGQPGSASTNECINVPPTSGAPFLAEYHLGSSGPTGQNIDLYPQGYPTLTQTVHISCRNLTRPGYCYISDMQNDPATPIGYEQIYAIKLDTAQTVEVFGLDHGSYNSCSSCNDFAAIAVPTRDGTRVLFQSDWGKGTSSPAYDYLVQWGTSSASITNTPTPTTSPGSGTTLTPAGGVMVTQPATLSSSSVARGGTLSGKATLKNPGTTSITLSSIVLAGRPPGGTNSGGPTDDFSPEPANMTLAPGQSYTLSASRTFSATDPTGTWYSYVTYQTTDGAWHDDPHDTYFSVTTSPAATPTTTRVSSPTPTATRAPSPLSTNTPAPTATSTSSSVSRIVLENFEGTLDGTTGNASVTAMSPSTWAPAVALGRYALSLTYTVLRAGTEVQLRKVVGVDLHSYTTLSSSVYPLQPTAANAGVQVRFLMQGSNGSWYSSLYQTVPIGKRTTVTWNMSAAPRSPMRQVYVCWRFSTSATSSGNRIYIDAVMAS